jgi:hypothetical protein
MAGLFGKKQREGFQSVVEQVRAARAGKAAASAPSIAMGGGAEEEERRRRMGQRSSIAADTSGLGG